MHSFASNAFQLGLLAMGTVLLCGLSGCLGIVESDGYEDPTVDGPGNADAPDCVARCEKTATGCGAPASLAESECGKVCAMNVTAEQLECMEASPCDEMMGAWSSGSYPCGIGSGATGGTTQTSTGGTPCSYLHGRATLTRYTGDNYASSAFSFEYASQDPEVTNNEFDVLYQLNHFQVNMVTDDVSFIVDLGDVGWDEVPEMVEPQNFPVGNWGEHDAIQAYLGHGYFVRSVDSAGRGVAAFRVVGLEPGVRVTIDWVRSVHPDRFEVPTGCEWPQDDAEL